MSNPAISNTYMTFESKGLREQLSDVVYMTSPTETPLVSMIPKTRTKGTLYEWQTDVLAAAVTTNAQLEGQDVTTFPAVVPTARVGNYQQISTKLLIVSGTAEEVEKAGRKSEINYQTVNRGAELKRDIEATVFSNQGGNAGSDTTPRQTATLGAWLKTNTTIGTGAAADPVYTAGVPSAARTDGTQAAFTETILKATIAKMFAAGATLKYMFVGPVNKAKVSGFAGIATKTYEISGRKPGQATIVGAADVYVSDFGTLTVVPSRLMRERDAYLIDPSFLELPHLRPFRREDLAKTGDAAKLMLLVEWGLKVRAESALGAAFDLTTT